MVQLKKIQAPCLVRGEEYSKDCFKTNTVNEYNHQDKNLWVVFAFAIFYFRLRRLLA